MTMKKRVLGLALAAMVALPATSVHAASFNENDTHNQDVTVTGTVRNADGIAPEGTIEVELPTSMQFSVDQAGTFTGSTYQVTNKSKVGIDVSVASFSESNNAGGINILPMNTANFDEKTRDNVALQLTGNTSNVVDLAEFAKTGVVGDKSKLLNVQSQGGVGTITLNGKAGKKISDVNANGRTYTADVDNKGVNENFNLVFQIKKESK